MITFWAHMKVLWTSFEIFILVRSLTFLRWTMNMHCKWTQDTADDYPNKSFFHEKLKMRVWHSKESFSLIHVHLFGDVQLVKNAIRTFFMLNKDWTWSEWKWKNYFWWKFSSISPFFSFASSRIHPTNSPKMNFVQKLSSFFSQFSKLFFSI